MPAIYAHYRFGNLILPKLPADVRGAIQRNRHLFDAGLQGPDFLLYYRPASSNPVSDLSRTFHSQTGAVFFDAACRTLERTSTEAELAYLYGLLGHYCLDSYCHPLVDQQVKNHRVGHHAMESAFERYLLELDGVARPESYPRGRLLKLTKKECQTVSGFFPGTTPEQIREAFKSMRRFTGLMTCGNPLHRTAAKAVLYVMGRERTGLLLPSKAETGHRERNEALLDRFAQAMVQYPVLLEQVRDHITFREPFGEGFEKIFG